MKELENGWRLYKKNFSTENDRLYGQYLTKAYEHVDQSIFVNDDHKESVKKELLQKIADLPK